jgi:hypothetical protein
MGRKAELEFSGKASNFLGQVERKTAVELILPPAHPRQGELINAFDARIDPANPEVGIIYNEEYPGFESLPKAYPDLKFIAGACGSKFGKVLPNQNWMNSRNAKRICVCQS